jgi:hypothetical protein
MLKFTTFLFLIIPFTLWTQSRIEQLVLEHVNNLRDSLNIPILTIDETLTEACNDHAYYISNQKNITHFQQTFRKETPSSRVEYYGGNRTYIGENIGQCPLKLKLDKSIDEDNIALCLFKGWFNSREHYSNMTNMSFTKMGLAVHQNYKNYIYSAQLFSSDEIKLPYEFNNNEFSWGVRPAETTCKDQPVVYQTMFFANSVQQRGNDIYLYYHDIDFFRNVINQDNDGLAIDIVLREQLPCSKENQFHISQIFDGEMQQPIYKNDIFRYNESNNPKKVLIKIGEVPEYLANKQWNANIIIINDNKLCDYSIPAEVPSDIYPLLPIPPYFDTTNTSQETVNIKSINIKDTVKAELYFQRSDRNFSDARTVTTSDIEYWQSYVKHVDVECFASVEGASWYNERLLKEREISVKQFLFKTGIPLTTMKIESSENWDLFNQHRINFPTFKDKTNSQIKSIFKNNKSSIYDSILFDQRKTHLTAFIDTTIIVDSYEDMLFAAQFDSMLNLNMLPWNKILKNRYVLNEQIISPELIDSLANYKELKTNLLGASYIRISKFNIDSVTTENLLSNVQSENSRQLFNYINFITNYWYLNLARSYETNKVANTVTPNTLLDLTESLDTNIIKPADFTRLKINILLSGIHYYVAHNNWEPVNSYFEAITELVKLNNFTPTEAMELALFCNHFHKFKITVKILEPFHDKKTLTENGYFVLAKTAVLLQNYLDKETYHLYMQSAKESNRARYCKWLDDSFQIQRDEYLKKDFCKECK